MSAPARLRPHALGRTVLLLLTLCLALVATTACSGAEESDLTPAQALAKAKRQLDSTSGIQLELSTPQLPGSVTGLVAATGVGTSAPAFDGEIRVSVAGVGATVPVISVDGTTYATLPFTTEFVEIDPAEYGAPDPAQLFGTTDGLSALLTKAQKPTAGEAVREGSLVFTRYAATLPGSVLQAIVPVAPAGVDFDATFTLDQDQRMTRATLTGPFYGEGTESLTYTIVVTDYGITPDITAPPTS